MKLSQVQRKWRSALGGAGLLPFDELLGWFEPELGAGQIRTLAALLDEQDVEISFDFPRAPAPAGGRAARSRDPLAQYRLEVRRIPVLDRDREILFCMGLELAWERLQNARRAAGFPEDDVTIWPGREDLGCRSCVPGRERVCYACAPAGLDPAVRRRLRARHAEFQEIRNELLERNLHIVFRLLERYRNVAVLPEDMVQEANQSLFRAVENFDWQRGVRFKTYAAYWVNQAFLNAIYNQSRTVRVPAYIQKAMKKIHDASGKLEGSDDPAAISAASGVDEDLVQNALTGNRFTLSLDKTYNDEGEGGRMVDLVDAEEDLPEEHVDLGAESSALRAHLEKAISVLSLREQRVLQMRFGLDDEEEHTLAEVGDELGISLERVRQIQKAALEKLRTGRVAPFLDHFLPN